MLCTNEEFGKHDFNEYSIQSMSQTRAEGKAWRMLLGWVMKAAGFEQMPAEEIPSDKPEFNEDCPTPDEKDLLFKLAASAIFHLDETENTARKKECYATIVGCVDYNLFNRIEQRLRALQPTIDQVINPSQEDIKKHIKKLR
jgi:hypothetical protein